VESQCNCGKPRKKQEEKDAGEEEAKKKKKKKNKEVKTYLQWKGWGHFSGESEGTGSKTVCKFASIIL